MMERGGGSFKRKDSYKSNYETQGKFLKKSHYRDEHNEYNDSFKRRKGGNRHAFQKDKRKSFNEINNFKMITKPDEPRKYTVSIAVAASILNSTVAKDELRTYVVGQIARSAVIYSIDEIIVYDDGCWQETNSSDQQNQAQMALDKMKILLEYQELPQYLRKYFFGFDKNLRFVGVLNPLNSSHHLKSNEWCEYREGVVLEESKGSCSFVDIGFQQPVLIDQKLESGLRVTVKLPPVPKNMDDPCGSKPCTVVSPEEPREKGGYYWGYTVRIAKSLSEVVDESKYSEGYDLIIGTSDKGKDAHKVEYPTFSHALIIFGGVEGIEAAIRHDSQIQVSDPFELFHLYINTCLLQQVRTIRTEEAVLISLCVLHDKLRVSGVQ